MLPHPGPGSKRVPPPQSLPQLINNRVIVVEGWPRLQDQCGRDVGRGNSNLGAPTAWVKAHRSQSHFKVTQVPKSLLSATTAAVPWSPASKCSALGLNASSSSLAIPPTPHPAGFIQNGYQERLPRFSGAQRICGLLPGGRRGNRGEIQSMCAKSRNFPDFPGCRGKLGQRKSSQVGHSGWLRV